MGSCSGKSNAAPVRVIPTTRTVNSQRPQSQQTEAQSKENEASMRYEQRPGSNPDLGQGTENHIVKEVQRQQEPQKVEVRQSQKDIKKEVVHKEHIVDDDDETAFASQFQRNNENRLHSGKANEGQKNDVFALNFPNNEFVKTTPKKNEASSKFVNPHQNEKHRDKKLRDIINNPDDNEDSMLSDGNHQGGVKHEKEEAREKSQFHKTESFKYENQENQYTQIAEQKPEKQENVQPQQYHHEHEEKEPSARNSLQVETKRNSETERSHKLESASPSSGVIKSEAVLKEKQEQKKVVISPQKTEIHAKEKKQHQWKDEHEEEDVRHDYEGEDMNSARDVVVQKKVEKTPQKHGMKDSKLPWERRSGLQGSPDENEIEFFDEEFDMET